MIKIEIEVPDSMMQLIDARARMYAEKAGVECKIQDAIIVNFLTFEKCLYVLGEEGIREVMRKYDELK